MANFNSEHKIILDEMLLEIQNVYPGKIFGYPAYLVGKKLSI